MQLSGLRGWTITCLVALLLAGLGIASLVLPACPALAAGRAQVSGGYTKLERPGSVPLQAAVDAGQVVSATLIKSVGIRPDTACSGATSLEVGAGATVYFCYTLTNTGSAPFQPLTLIDGLSSSNAGEPVNWTPPSPGFVVQRGASLPATLENGLIRAVQVGEVGLQARAEWTVDPGTGTGAEKVVSNNTDVRVVTLGITASTTVGVAAGCTTTTSVASSSYLAPVYFCVTVVNSSPVTLTNFRISLPGLNLFNISASGQVGPSGGSTAPSVQLTSASAPQLANYLRSPSIATRAFVTATNAGGNLTVNAVSDQATASGPGPTVTLLKTLNTDPNSCSNISTLSNVTYKQPFYYCLLLSNTNSFTYTNHVFTEQAPNIAGSFQAPLGPGQTITLNNGTASRYGLGQIFGPIEASRNIANQMVYTASNPIYNYQATSTASTSIFIIQPTATSTEEPTPTITPIPFDTADANLDDDAFPCHADSGSNVDAVAHLYAVTDSLSVHNAGRCGRHPVPSACSRVRNPIRLPRRLIHLRRLLQHRRSLVSQPPSWIRLRPLRLRPFCMGLSPLCSIHLQPLPQHRRSLAS